MPAGGYWTGTRARRLRRRTFIKGAAGTTAALTTVGLVGCGDDDDGDGSTGRTATSGASQGSGTPRVGGQYRWAWQGTPHLDMHQDSISGAQNIIAAAYNRLLRFQDEAQLPEPDLAESMPEQPDEQTYIFKIHQNVAFHDKPPVNGRT